VTIRVCNQPPRSTQPGHPSVGRRNNYQRNLGRKQAHYALAPCPWSRSVKTGIWLRAKETELRKDFTFFTFTVSVGLLLCFRPVRESSLLSALFGFIACAELLFCCELITTKWCREFEVVGEPSEKFEGRNLPAILQLSAGIDLHRRDIWCRSLPVSCSWFTMVKSTGHIKHQPDRLVLLISIKQRSQSDCRSSLGYVKQTNCRPITSTRCLRRYRGDYYIRISISYLTNLLLVHSTSWITATWLTRRKTRATSTYKSQSGYKVRDSDKLRQPQRIGWDHFWPKPDL